MVEESKIDKPATTKASTNVEALDDDLVQALIADYGITPDTIATQDSLGTATVLHLSLDSSTISKPESGVIAGVAPGRAEARLIGFAGHGGHNWPSIQTTYAQIIDSNEDSVLLRCLLDEESRVFETRKFDIAPFQGAVDLENGKFVEIKILTRPGERRFVYQNATRKDLKKIFKKANPFAELENSVLFNAPQPELGHHFPNF